MYDVLLEANKVRGSFAYGHCIYGKSKTPYHIGKFKTAPKPESIKEQKGNIFYFGHCQAPTSASRTWNEDNSHPFYSEDWIVAHNGVLSNFDDLQENFNPGKKNLLVDTSIIPLMLQAAGDNVENALKTVLERLEGTFGLWIINTKHNRAFIVRQGSTLFANPNTGSFCSLECKSDGWIEVPEGYIYEIDYSKKRLQPIDKFKTKSPFLFVP